ncbi:MAG: hypothetical protein IJY62_05410 [Clostridia bacterium]|nr:hypothetical protein [Clostridia bacterium]
MRRKNLCWLLAVFAAALTLTGCDADKEKTVIKERTQLNTPENVRVDGEVLSWDAVENAENYVVEYLYSETENATAVTVTTASTSYDLLCELPGVYAARVRAFAPEDSFYSRSEWSDWFEIFSDVTLRLSAPTGVIVESGEIRWDAVENASGYEISVNGEQPVRVSGTNFTGGGFLPGRDYEIKVRATAENDGYYADSDWSTPYSYEFGIEYTVPANVRVEKDGTLRWNTQSFLTNGYTVAYKKLADTAFTEARAETEEFDLTALESGDYEIKIKANGLGEAVESAYTEPLSVRVTQYKNWSAQDLVNDFSQWNGCYATLTDGVAALRCGLGWGGLISPTFELDYNKNPVFVLEYDEVSYGYMGNFYLDGEMNIYAPDVQGAYTDLTLRKPMNENFQGAIKSATGIVKNVSLSVGFTYAPTGASDRIVSKISSARVVYVEEIAKQPASPQKISAPSDLRFSGMKAYWSSPKGNSEYSPTFKVELLGKVTVQSEYVVLHTFEHYKYTNCDLSVAIGQNPAVSYTFRVTAEGDGKYFTVSDAVVSVEAQITSQKVDLQAFATNSVSGLDTTPQATYADGKLTLRQASGYGTRKYTLPFMVDTKNSYISIDFESVSSGNYYLRLPVSGYEAGANSILSHDSSVTGTFMKKLTEVEALASLNGSFTLDLHFGLSGNNVVCVVKSISVITVKTA